MAPAYDLYGSQTRVDLDRVAWVRLDHQLTIKFPDLGDALFYFKYLCVDRAPGRADRWFLCGNFASDQTQLLVDEYNGEAVRHRVYVQRSEEEIAAIALRDGKSPEEMPGSVSPLMRSANTAPGAQPPGAEAGRSSDLDAERIARRVAELISAAPTAPGKATATESAAVNELPPSCRRAYASFLRASEKNPNLKTDEKIYNHLKTYGCEAYEGDKLPGFETWQRYLRTARRRHGAQKNSTRAGRPVGPSVVRSTQTG
jgi:hypothetical protein